MSGSGDFQLFLQLRQGGVNHRHILLQARDHVLNAGIFSHCPLG